MLENDPGARQQENNHSDTKGTLPCFGRVGASYRSWRIHWLVWFGRQFRLAFRIGENLYLDVLIRRYFTLL